jgi:hypothetical protein
VIKAAGFTPETKNFTDDKGEAHTVTLRKPSVLSQFRFVAAVGAELAQNLVWMQMAQPLLWIGAIDGQPEPTPSTINEVEALIQRLGDDGNEVIGAFWMEKVGQPAMEAMGDAQRQARERDALKN